MHARKSVTYHAMKTISCAIALMAMVPGIGLAETTTNAVLPGGASSLQETYDNWQVTCVVRKQAPQCALSQQQRQQQNNQLVLSVEFAPEQKDGAVTGNLVLPFGLLLQSGVTLQIDDKPVTPALGFRTCLPIGCIVPVTLDKAMIANARAGTVLKITATSSDGNKTVPLSVPLKGMGNGLDRMKALVGK